jgi:hypothetical protein
VLLLDRSVPFFDVDAGDLRFNGENFLLASACNLKLLFCGWLLPALLVLVMSLSTIELDSDKVKRWYFIWE